MTYPTSRMPISFGLLGGYSSGTDRPEPEPLQRRLGWPEIESVQVASSWLVRSSALSPPEAPLRALEGNVTIHFTGSLLNGKELAAQLDDPAAAEAPPTQLCALLYRRYGDDFAARINGLFSIVLMDGERDRLLLIADRYGSSQPLYYRPQPRLLFADRVKVLLRGPDGPPPVDTDSLAIFLKYSYLPAPRSILSGVRRLGPGMMLTADANGITVRRYRDFWRPRLELSLDEACDRYLELLDRSLRRKIGDFEAARTGFFLSGGLDSSANVLLASRAGMSPIRTFGIGVADPAVDERPFARQVAEQFGAEFTGYEYDGSELEDFPRMVWYLDEPFMENGLFLAGAAFRESSLHVDMVVAGDGADQLFGTGGFANGLPLAGRWLMDRSGTRGLGAWLRRRMTAGTFYCDNAAFKAKALLGRMVDYNDWFFWGFDDHELDACLRGGARSEAIRCFENRAHRPDRPITSFLELKEWSAAANDMEHYVCQNLMHKSSRMAECYGVQLREIYLDDEVIDFLMALSPEIRAPGSALDHLRGRSISKLLHRRAMADLLPGNILNRPKQGGFVPLRMLLLEPGRRGKVFDYLRRSSAITEHCVPERIDGLLRESDSLYGRSGVSALFFDCRINQVMNLLSFAVWHDVIYAGDGALAPPRQSLKELLTG